MQHRSYPRITLPVDCRGISLQDKMNMPKLKADQVIARLHSPQDDARAFNMTN